MHPRRVRLVVILATLAGGALTLLGWTAPWFQVALAEGTGGSALEIPGSVASPALAALGLSALALGAALAIAGPGIRVVLGVLAVVLGGCIVLAAAISVGDPIAASAAAISEHTGISGAGSLESLVASVSVRGWPVIAFAGAVVLIGAGVGVLATLRHWPGPSRRYRSSGFEPEPPAGFVDGDRAVDDWDELSRGDDPTERSS
jgi:uncharacterized membrane protein (TIGR02234 family)